MTRLFISNNHSGEMQNVVRCHEIKKKSIGIADIVLPIQSDIVNILNTE